jgi:hypothetical protein
VFVLEKYLSQWTDAQFPKSLTIQIGNLRSICLNLLAVNRAGLSALNSFSSPDLLLIQCCQENDGVEQPSQEWTSMPIEHTGHHRGGDAPIAVHSLVPVVIHSELITIKVRVI